MPLALITGANRGLGLDFSRQYVRDGWQVIGCCRDPGAADLLVGVGAEVMKLDVTKIADDPNELFLRLVDIDCTAGEMWYTDRLQRR